MTRRDVFEVAGAAVLFAGRPAMAQGRFIRNFGVAGTSFGARTAAGGGRRGRGGRAGAGAEAPAGAPAKPALPPFDIIEYAREMNVGVVEASPPAMDSESIRKFRQRLESYNLRVIMGAPLPKDPSGVEAFDAAVKACKEAGAMNLRAAMTGRRYEEFDTFEKFKANFEQCQKQVALAEPVLRKHRIALALENHKGWRAEEHAAWLKRTGSEWLGVHFDFGNNVALCEDPAETLKTLYPHIISCHIKDMAVEMYDDGFLLSEVPLGEGFLDIQGMVTNLQKKDPNMAFNLEMMTRDPLRIPVFTPGYWATFDDVYSPLPGRDLARVLDLVRKNKPKQPLWYTTKMSADAVLKLEDLNNRKCIEFARQMPSM
ncbi:MAG: sugar phosphate isomerase/epimerase [Bryobacterales bacterium]|nr:sugar phosphate isomerase/epimerase [Bryobacterales bacterium]